MDVTKVNLPDEELLNQINPLELIELQSQITDFVTFLETSIIKEEVNDEQQAK